MDCMPTDIEIAQSVTPKRIEEIAKAAGIPDEAMTQILNLISQSTSGGSEDIYYSEDGYYEDSYYYEEEFYS